MASIRKISRIPRVPDREKIVVALLVLFAFFYAVTTLATRTNRFKPNDDQREGLKGPLFFVIVLPSYSFCRVGAFLQHTVL